MTVNETLGAWSELFMLLAAMTYLVAFVAFAWDVASHSKTLRGAEGSGERELVGAAAGASAATSGDAAEPADSGGVLRWDAIVEALLQVCGHSTVHAACCSVACVMGRKRACRSC